MSTSGLSVEDRENPQQAGMRVQDNRQMTGSQIHTSESASGIDKEYNRDMDHSTKLPSPTSGKHIQNIQFSSEYSQVTICSDADQTLSAPSSNLAYANMDNADRPKSNTTQRQDSGFYDAKSLKEEGFRDEDRGYDHFKWFTSSENSQHILSVDGGEKAPIQESCHSAQHFQDSSLVQRNIEVQECGESRSLTKGFQISPTPSGHKTEAVKTIGSGNKWQLIADDLQTPCKVCYKNPNEADDVSLQISRLWMSVKMLSLAVVLLTVVMVILCCVIYGLQFKDMTGNGQLGEDGGSNKFGDRQWMSKVPLQEFASSQNNKQYLFKTKGEELNRHSDAPLVEHEQVMKTLMDVASLLLDTPPETIAPPTKDMFSSGAKRRDPHTNNEEEPESVSRKPQVRIHPVPYQKGWEKDILPRVKTDDLSRNSNSRPQSFQLKRYLPDQTVWNSPRSVFYESLQSTSLRKKRGQFYREGVKDDKVYGKSDKSDDNISVSFIDVDIDSNDDNNLFSTFEPSLITGSGFFAHVKNSSFPPWQADSKLLTRKTRATPRALKALKRCCKQKSNKSGHHKSTKVMSESYEGNFEKLFDLHKRFTEECITEHKWPQNPEICRDTIVRIKHAGTRLGFFQRSSGWKSKMLTDFNMKKGQFKVKKKGLYLVQAHLFMEDKTASHWAAIFANEMAMLACRPGGFRSSTNARGRNNQRVCHMSGILKLSKNSTLEIRTMEPHMEIPLKPKKMPTFKIVRLH
ncbi:hypothetical protein PoB_004409000 [Plakobranchus ocellatus]|uniref:TNF family profile domain-containing protein n=1 Tax=Plakobranchus ocellatus TaxID=259542 RepID=A0AAV4BDF9_9GAST|nr:hypothetical protein PoB_004409000 [Plakobranchus ocellatus]